MGPDGNAMMHAVLQNRVTPFGELVAIAERGGWTGNRGVLHDAERRIVRPWQNRRWIICRLEFKGRHRQVMTPGRWTELFFLDEATALAAGHRPCAECRRNDFNRFAAAWPHPLGGRRATEIDDVLHQERHAPPATAPDPARLPDGTMVAAGATAYLVWGGGLRPWSPAGYLDEEPKAPAGPLRLLTPPSTVATIGNGYVPQIVGPTDD